MNNPLTAEKRLKKERFSRTARKLGICGWYMEPPVRQGGRLLCKLDARHKGKHHAK